jgi:hypothetical protein
VNHGNVFPRWQGRESMALGREQLSVDDKETYALMSWYIRMGRRTVNVAIPMQGDVQMETNFDTEKEILASEICDREWRGRGLFVCLCRTQPLACRDIRLRLDADQLQASLNLQCCSSLTHVLLVSASSDYG